MEPKRANNKIIYMMLALLGAWGVLLCCGEVFSAGRGKLLGGEWGWGPEIVKPRIRHPESTGHSLLCLRAPPPPHPEIGKKHCLSESAWFFVFVFVFFLLRIMSTNSLVLMGSH